MKKITFIKNFALASILFLSVGTLSAATYSGGTGTVEDPYLISNKADLLALSDGANKADWTKAFLITADIDMAATTFTPIGVKGGAINASFNGTIDGGSHIISNLTVTPVADQTVVAIGFVGWSFSCTLKNIGIKNINIAVAGERVGGILGHGEGTSVITNCFVYGGSIGGTGRIGGICGMLPQGSITDCLAKVTKTDTWSGSQGGIVGSLGNNWSGPQATVNNVVNYSIQAAGKAICAVTMLSAGVGPVFTNAYFIENAANIDVNCTAITSDNLKLQASYTGFNFTDKWTMLPNSYAVLKSFPASAFTGLADVTTKVSSVNAATFKYAYSAQESKISYDTEIVKASIYSSNGSVVMNSNETVKSLSLANLSKGIYLVKATSAAGETLITKICK